MDKKYSDIDAEHCKTLQQFRKNVEDIIKPEHSDEFLLVWLRARNFDLRKAERMLRVSLNMRTIYQVPSYPTDFKMYEAAKRYQFVGFLGFDKEGSPVRYIALRDADLVGFVMSMSTFEIGHYCEYIIETDRLRLEAENKRTGRSASGYNYIFDMAGFSLQQLFVKPVIETGLDLIKIYQELHPDDVKAIYCINAPVYFYAAYNLFKPILRLSLLEKIHVLSKDSDPEKLLKNIDPEVLPTSIGGSRVDPDGDPTCRSIIQYGGKVPEDLYKINQELLQENDPGVKTVLIPARSFYQISIPVEKAGSILHIDFRSEHYSIMLWLSYKPLPFGFMSGDDLDHLEIKKPCEEELDILSSQARIQSHVAPVNEDIFCERPGIYIFHFDNTYSLLHSKRILYRTDVLPPAE